MEFFIPCWVIMSNMFSGLEEPSAALVSKFTSDVQSRLAICEQVAQAARRRNVDPILAISIAFAESKFTDIVSKKKARGPLGVMPKYHCKGENALPSCDYIEAGIQAIETVLSLSNFDYCSALALYNRGISGKCEQGRSEYNYAQSVLDLYTQVCNFTDSCHDC